MEKSKSSLLSSSVFCVRQMVLRVGFKFRLATARVRVPAPSRLLMALLAGVGMQAMALPQGGQVAAGNVTIAAPSGGSLNITQTTDKGVINWQSFNVGSGEKVNFQQPGATSSTLNRVIGSDPSSIFGQINANGQVFLINNSGILFAPGSQVNAAGLVASTLQLADADYLSGNFSLTGGTGSVDNQGTLKAGFVALAGAQVSNTGTIVADNGTAALAAGGRVTLNLIGSDLVSVSVDAPTAAALVHSGGIVQADGGRVVITAKAADALLGTVVNVDGIVQAHAIGSRNGVITLDGGGSGVVNVSGTLDASGKGAGETGGTVKVTGANVGLFGGATIDASGDAGGGVVRVGGDWHGAGADGDANASQAFMGAGSTIKANAITAGNGGNVVVWSDDRTQFLGKIDASGGSASGNGGAVETSSHQSLQASGTVDASAAKGQGGSWLIDPDEILITASSSSNIVETSGVWSNTAAASVLDGAALSGSINSNAAVTVQTAGTGNGNITVDAQITASPDTTGTLTLSAAGNIAFTGNGSMVIGAGSGMHLFLDAGVSGGTAGVNASMITMATGSFIDLGTTGSFSATAKGAVHLSQITAGGNLDVTSNGGAVDQETGAGQLLTIGGSTTINAGAAPVTLNNTSNLLTGDVVVNNSGNNNVAVDNNRALSLGASSVGTGTLTVTATGAISQTGAITQAAGAGIASFDASANAINLGNTGNTLTGAVRLTSTAGNVTLTDSANLTLDAVSIGVGTNTITVGGGTGATLTRGSAALSAGSTPVLSVGGQAVDSTVAGYFSTGSADSVVLGATASAVNVTATGASVLPAMTVSGDLSVTAASASGLSETGALAVSGNASFDGGAHGIALSTATNSFGGRLTLTNSGTEAVAVKATGAVTIQSASVGSGDLSIVTDGDISQVNAITQATSATPGAVSFTAGAHDIDLGNFGNDFSGAVSLSNSGTVTTTLKDTNSLTLGTIDIASGANIGNGNGASDTLTRTTALTSAPLLNLHVGGHVVNLTVRDYFVSGAATNVTLGATGAGINVTAQGASVLPALTVSGALNVTADGTNAISQTGALAVTGNASFDGNGQGIDLSGATNTFGSHLALNNTGTGIVSVNASGPLTFDTSVLGSGALSVVTTGAITQVGAITQTAGATSASFSTGAAVITLDNTGNSFTGPTSINNSGANNVAITASGALELGTSAIGTGNLAVIAGGAITQGAGGITQASGAGTVSFDAGAHAIALTAGNDFTGAVSLTNSGANNVAINDANTLTLGTVSVGAGTLAITSNGALAQTGTITQAASAGAVTINAGAGTIDLDTVGNAFTGAVGLNNSGANNVTLRDGGALALGPSAIGSGLLTVNVGGDLTQSGALTQAAGASGSSFVMNGHALALTNTGNDFVGTVTPGGASAVAITDVNSLSVGAVNIGTGTLALVSNGALTVGNITQSAGGGAVTVNAHAGSISLNGTNAITGAVNLSNTGNNNITLSNGEALNIGGITAGTGTLSVTASGDITQTGAITQAAGAGAATFNSLGNAITLTNAGNDFTGAVGLLANGSAAASLTDAHSVALGASTIGTGLLTVHATGDITQTGDVTTGGAATFTASGGNVTLSRTGNTFAGLVTASGSSVTVAATNDLDVDATLTSGAGNLNLSAGGALSGPAAVTTMGNITLASGAALATGGVLSGHDVSLTGSSVSLGDDVTAANLLTLHSTAGAIAQTAGAVTAHGAASLTADSGNAITLNGAGNDFIGLVTASGGTIGLHDANDLGVHLASATTATLVAGGALTVDGATSVDLHATGAGVVFGPGTTTVVGALTANSGAGTIAQTGKLAVTGTSSLTAGGTLTLADGTNTFGGVITASGSSVDIAANGNLDVTPTLGAGGSLTLAAGGTGALTIPAGAITTTGDVSLSAGAGLTTSGDIHANNVTLGGGAITIANHIVASGTFAATSSSTIVETGVGDIHATGAATLNAGANAITLSAATNNFGSVTVTGGAVTIVDADALTAHLTSTTSANLTAGGTGTLTVDGTTSAGNLVVAGDGVVFGSGATTVHGALNANSGAGTMTQTGTLAVTGASTLNAGTNAITLDNAGNDFTGAVTATGALTLRDVNDLGVHLALAASANLGAGGVLTVDGTTLGALSASGNGVMFGTTTIGDALTANSGSGTITQTGAVSVVGNTSLAATGHDITLAIATNDFQGAVSVASTNATLADFGVLAINGSTANNLVVSGVGIAFGPMSVGGTLNAISAGPITQAGALAVTGTSALNAGASPVTLTNASNDFGGLVTVHGGAVQLTDANAMSVALTSAASATLVAGGVLSVSGSPTGDLNASGNGVVLGTTSVGGALNANSGTGNITQSGVVAVTGLATLNAGSNALTLTNASNDFGNVSASGATVSLKDANAMAVHLGTVGSATLVAGGALNIDGATSGALVVTGGGVAFGTTNVGDTLSATTTGGGAITQSGALTVANASTLNAGANAITLATPANNFGGAVTATGGTVALGDSGALAVHLAGVGSATLVAVGPLSVDGSTTGALAAHGGTISQTNALTVGGTTLLDAGSNNVTLTNAGNHFTGLVTASGGAVALVDSAAMSVHLATVDSATLNATGALNVDGATASGLTANGNGVAFGATSVGGALNATSGGAITQAGALAVTGTTSLDAGANAITLANTANTFGGQVAVNGGAVTLAAANALTVDGTAGSLNVTGNGVTFGGGTTNVSGTLSATTTGGGAIAQTGALNVGGTSALNAGAGDVTLANAGNSFGGALTATGGAFTLDTAAGAVVHLDVASATLGAGGTISVDGAATGDLAASGTGVTFGAAGTHVGGALTATATTGSIVQSGAVGVAGASTLTASAGSVGLNNAGNDFGGLVTVSAGTGVGLTSANALGVHLAGVADAALVAGGVLTVDGSSAGVLQATGNGIVFGPGATTVGGALTANSGSGTITQTGALVVAGNSALDAGGNAVTLATATNDFGGAVTVTGGTVSLADANALTAHLNNTGDTTLNAAGALGVDGSTTAGLSASGSGVVFGPATTQVAGALAVNSGTGTITQTGALSVGGTSTLEAGTGAITLTNSANDFTGAVTTTGGVVALADANTLAVHLANASSETLTAHGVLTVDGSTGGAVTASGNGVVFGATSVGGNLAVASGSGTITQTGALSVGGATSLTAGSSDIALANAANDFTGAVTATGGAVSLADANALAAHVTAASATLSAGGALAVDGSTTGALAASGGGVAFGPAATTVHGALTVASSGAVTQSGDLAVTGATTIAAGGQSVTLARSTNQLAGGVTVAAASADIEQAGALTVHLNGAGSAVLASGAALSVDGTSSGDVTASGSTVTLTASAPLTAHVTATGNATLTSTGALSVDGSSGGMTLTGSSVAFGAAGTTVNGALTTNGGGVTQAGTLSVTGASTFNAGSGDIALVSSGNNLQGTIDATGHAISIADAHAIDATLAAGGDVVLSSTSDVTAKGTFGGGLKASGAKVTLATGTATAPLLVNGLLDVTSTGDTSLGDVTSNGAIVAAGGAVLLGGTLKSAGDVSLTGAAIQGVNKLGALDVAAGSTVTLDTSSAGGGNIGKTTPLSTVDPNAIIMLLNATGQSGLSVNFNQGQSAWFRVSSQTQTHLLKTHQFDFLSAQTFFCDMATCVNVLGQTTAVADSVISNILSAAAQDAADAAFGTENLDFAIRKGYITTIGRVPPGIDEIAGDLGATQCDSRVTSPTAIAAETACK